MKKIAIDMSPIVHGTRAVSNCTASIAGELIKNEDVMFDLLYFDYKFQTKKYLRPLGNRCREKVIPLPLALLIPAWKRLAWPHFEMVSSASNILYVNEFYFPPAKKAVVLATIHGLAYRIIPDKISPQIIQAFNRGLSYILTHADYLCAVSETTKKELIEHVGIDPDRIYVVSHGVDKKYQKRDNADLVAARLNQTYGLDRPYILYVGAIGLHKNIMGILTAYEKISSLVSHDLVMAGPPDSAWNDAQRFVYQHNLAGRVHFLGHIYESDLLIDIYNAADVFVFPSFYEGWTSPPLEAMACGTPVIASNCSSLPETLSDAAVLVNPDDSDELAFMIEKVLADKELQSELIQKGIEHASLHTWQKSAENMNAVFADICTRGPWEGNGE